MLSLKPERSAIIRMNPGGRLQVDFVTVTGGVAPLEDVSIKLRIGPAVRTISEMMSSITNVIMTSFLERIIVQPALHRSSLAGFLSEKLKLIQHLLTLYRGSQFKVLRNCSLVRNSYCCPNLSTRTTLRSVL